PQQEVLATYRLQRPEYADIPDEALAAALIRKEPNRWGPLLMTPGIGSPDRPFGTPDLPFNRGTTSAPRSADITTSDVLRGANTAAQHGLPMLGAMGG